ncbi:MAG: tetratricopeptide repeat protein [Bdellovibrionota bacterium]|jgi:tetratricopeptide (TPR) repeat protein
MSAELLSKALEYCQILAETHRNDLLRDKAREALSISPGHSTALMYLCRSSYNLGLYDELEETVRLAIKLHPQEPHFYFYLYLFFLHIGGAAYLDARRAIGEALRLRPESALYHRELGEVYLINWEPEKARECLQEAVRLDPNNAETISRLGLAELRCGNHNQAIQLAHNALMLSPDNQSVYNNAGQIFLFSGELDEAEKLFREALRRFPTYEYFQRQLSNCEREKSDRRERQLKNLRYTPLVLRQKGRKRFFDEEASTS